MLRVSISVAQLLHQESMYFHIFMYSSRKTYASDPAFSQKGKINRVFRLHFMNAFSPSENVHVTDCPLIPLPFGLLPPGLWSSVPDCSHCTATLCLFFSVLVIPLYYSAALFRLDWISKAVSSLSLFRKEVDSVLLCCSVAWISKHA